MASKQETYPSANTSALIFSERKPDEKKCWKKNLTRLVAGVDVTANQEEISNHETFQLEFEPKAGKWAIRTMQDKYFR